MADIIVKMLAPSVYTFHIKNRDDFMLDLDMPAAVMDMPEKSKSEAIATKLTGNNMKIDIPFLLKDYTGEVATLVDELTGGNAILTPMQQVIFLIDTFESKGINYRYRLSIDGASPAFQYDGVVTKISIRQPKGGASNFTCILTFQVANVITVINS